MGMWAKASISPLSELAREAGEAQPGRQRRSSIYPWAFLVDLSRRAITQALVLAVGVVKVQPGANTGLGFGDSRISMQVDLLVFETTPQPLDKDVVHASTLAVHADRDAMPLKGAGEVVTGELAALVGIEDFRSAIARKRFLERLDAKIGVERVGKAPGQHRAAHPVHDYDQVDKALGHRNVGDIGAPDLIDPLDR